MMTEANYSLEEKAQLITQAAASYRRKNNIVPTRTQPGFEGSCFALGEWRNLFFAQLVPTRDGYGDWQNITPNQSNKEIITQLFDWLREQGLL